MPNYNQAHQFYAGVDLHARSLFVRLAGQFQCSHHAPHDERSARGA